MVTVEKAMKSWKKLTLKEKEKIFFTWELSAGDRWESDFSQLKVDELFDLLGGTELPNKIIKSRSKKKLKDVT